MERKVIGIMGGMGPEATAELFMRIIRATPAKRDQDHLRIIIDNNPKVPDRTAAILGEGPDPMPEMLKTGQVLERAGADFIVIPCNTAHHYFNELTRNLRIPILHMIRLTAEKIHREHREVERAGLLATVGTIRSRIYHNAFEGVGVKILTPSDGLQVQVMEAIYAHIKAGDLEGGRRLIHGAARQMERIGAQIILCGCTEVSLVLRDGDISVPVVDPLQVLAEASVAVATGKMEIT